MKKYNLKRKGFDEVIGVYFSKQDAAHDLWNKTIELNDEGITPFDFELVEEEETSKDDLTGIYSTMQFLGEEATTAFVLGSNRSYLQDLDSIILFLRAWNKIDGYKNGGISIKIHMANEDKEREFIEQFNELWESVRFLKA